MLHVFIADPDTGQKKTNKQTNNKRWIYATFHMTCPMLIIDWTNWTHCKISSSQSKTKYKGWKFLTETVVLRLWG